MTVFNLEIIIPYGDQTITLNPSIIKDAEELFLVDCGYEGSLPLIAEQLATHGLKAGDLTGIIISHDDIDHIGGLFEIKTAYPALKIYSSQIEAPYLSGELKSLRLEQAESLFRSVPDEQKGWAIDFVNSLNSIKRTPIDSTFSFDFHFSDKMRIINTPGHTPGHISIYFPEEKTLIANDAIIVENGELEIANPQFALDLDEAVRSVGKILTLDIDRLICYHGGIVTDKIPQKLKGLIARYNQL